MSIDFEAEYNNGRRVPEAPQIAADWIKRSEALRASAHAELGLRYGAHERQRYDLYLPAQATAATPIAVFIHGGYWQGRHRHDFAFAAAGCLAHGVAFAMPSYRLCPEVKVADIIEDLRVFLVALYQHTGRRAAISGHSAGGHLTATLLATDWRRHAGAPQDLARHGYAISGVFDLAPLVTTSINRALGETVASSPAVSPFVWPVPPRGTCFTAAVGGAESGEFIRQSVDMAGHWSKAGLAAEAVIIPQANHFTVLEDLARPESAMVHRIVELARRAAS